MKEYEFDFGYQSQSLGDGRPPPFQRPIETRSPNRIRPPHKAKAIGVLASGGLDSCILLKHLLDIGYMVRPIYVRCGLTWEAAEQAALEQFIHAVSFHRLGPLLVLDLPIGDLYGDHWSITGRDVPKDDTPDAAVYLPGRIALLTSKAALWCQLHGVGDLAMGTLRTNPFEDAAEASLDRLGAAFSGMGPRPVRLVRPFGRLDKQQVMELGRGLPLHLTFSCLAPRGRTHCGRCNKCAERREAFRLIGREMPAEAHV